MDNEPQSHRATASSSEDDANEPEFGEFGEKPETPAPSKVAPTNDGEKEQAKAEKKAKAVANKIAKEKTELETLLATNILNNEVTLNQAMKIAHNSCVIEARERIKGLSQKGREDLKNKLTGKA